jgi:YidC/Oxa1 family membrane protein insertase
MHKHDKEGQKNYLIAAVLSTLVFVGWFYFVQKPALEVSKNIQSDNGAEQIIKSSDMSNSKEVSKKENGAVLKDYSVDIKKDIEAEEIITPLEVSEAGEIRINTPSLEGSISLLGAKFDNLKLKKYKETLDKDSADVQLLKDANSTSAYFGDFGWLSGDNSIKLPTSKSIWTTDTKELTDTNTVILNWDNGQGLLFQQIISVDENYMFKVQQSVRNINESPKALVPYGRIKQNLSDTGQSIFILHKGGIGVFNNKLEEISYKDLKKKGDIKFETKEGWIGITDKYWLTAMIPDKNIKFTGNFSDNGNDYKTGFIGNEVIVYPNQTITFTHHFFAGAKELKLLNDYKENLNIALFDRAIDFGWFYFLTKPMYLLLKSLYVVLGNFGLAIITMTLIVKGAMYPIATKSFVSMSKMKKLQPKIVELKKKYKDDRQRISKETMELYKREKVNPMSGCLPMFIQIPVFFSLYKVLYVTIDMRHAPFFGWMKDLSAQDTTSVWNLFGLLPYQAPHGMLSIGILPILMSLSMYLQQKLSPQPTDAAQATMIKWMPFIFLFLFAGFPSGLLVYWIFSNIFGIAQQAWINKKIGKN